MGKKKTINILTVFFQFLIKVVSKLFYNELLVIALEGTR